MLEANQVRVRLANALEGKESFSDLAEWLSKESASLRFSDKDLLDLVDSALSPLQVYFDRLIDEQVLRSELRLLISDDVQSVEIHFIFDGVDRSIKPDGLKPADYSQNQVAMVAFA